MRYEPADFYFNGELMPAWGASWSLAGLAELLDSSDSWDADYSHRDVWIIYCRIDHEGTVESCDPRVFLYVIQEVVLLLLRHSEQMLVSLKGDAEDPVKVHRQMVDAAFAMRRSVIEKGCAFWCSGTTEDLQQCVDWMERSRLPADDPRYQEPPHVESEKSSLDSLLKSQATNLHRLAQAGRFDRELRKELLRI
ncbi:hypothetical protein OKA04_20990 [Luteolibacter flavescens]|uniref:Uncharacterized protein n=1 Tax=Luteolibacter flavescens TaxID=1859460 RepID=A0ABT3FUY2_9BACT|nr:hypothetical protein [Luteolibacter flavescens]MCW1887227.1 hypothetical protein [Luteolibacter flavescens]